jgi:hypothetical protein
VLIHSLEIICSQIQQSLCTGEKVSWCLNSSTTERLPLVPHEKASIRVLREKGNLGDVFEQAIRAGPSRSVLSKAIDGEKILLLDQKIQALSWLRA